MSPPRGVRRPLFDQEGLEAAFNWTVVVLVQPLVVGAAELFSGGRELV